MGSTIRRFALFAIILVFLVLTIYLMVGGDSSTVDRYDSLVAKNDDSKVEFDKRKKYFVVNEDGSVTLTYGYTKVEEQEEVEEKVSQSIHAADDYREVAKAIGTQLVTTDKGTVASGYESYNIDGNKYPTYNQGLYLDVMINNSTESVRADCSGFSSAFLYYAGFESNYFSRASGEFGNMATLGKLQLSELEPGDVLRGKGNVDVCVYKDSQYVYIADWGDAPSSAGPVKSFGTRAYLTATQGYWEKFEIANNDISVVDNRFYQVYRAE